MDIPARRARGVTLIELMVAMAVSAAVMVGLAAVVNSQQRAYYNGHRVRAAQASGRAALLEIERRLVLAGYGMDAPLAFDFDRYKSGPCPTDFFDACERDSVEGPDEIVFFHRDPNYWVPGTFVPPEDTDPDRWKKEPSGNAWRILSLDEAGVKVVARAGTSFAPGQILQAVCPGGTRYAYFTVSTQLAELAANDTPTVALLASSTNDPFRRQDSATDACFNGGRARMFLIRRNRLHIRPVGVGGAAVPYLVLDEGVDRDGGGVGESDELVLAEGIENLQFAFELTGVATRGATPGVPIKFTQGPVGATSGDDMTTLSFPGTVAAGQFEYRPTSWYGYTMGPPPHATRLTDHQANIRAVRVALTTRSTLADPIDSNNPDSVLLNMSSFPAWMTTAKGFNRQTFQTTVPLRNMTVRAMNDF